MKSGLLLVDKPGGMTSHDVVGKMRRHLGRKDIGHAGTLDPMATGLLVLLIGKATKLSDFLLNGDKAYQTSVLLGVETDTDDITGEIQFQIEDYSADENEVRQKINELSGELELPVPIYSAIKVKGKKLYEKARKGETFTPPMKKMRFDELEIQSIESDKVSVSFNCSKGSYVRAWGKALGKALDCGACLATLRRTHSRPYSVDQAVKLDQLLELSSQEIYDSGAWIPMKQTLPDWPLLKVDGIDEKLVSNGQIPRRLERFLELEYAEMNPLQGIKVVSKRSGELISLLSFEPPLSFKIRRVFPNQ